MSFTEQYFSATNKIAYEAIGYIRSQMKDRESIYFFENPFSDDEESDEYEAFLEECENADTEDWGGNSCAPYEIIKTGYFDNGNPHLEIHMYNSETGQTDEAVDLEDLSYYFWCLVADSISYLLNKTIS